MIKITFYFATHHGKDGLRFSRDYVRGSLDQIRGEACGLFNTSCSVMPFDCTAILEGKYRTVEGHILFTILPCELGMEEQYRGDIKSLASFIAERFECSVATTIEQVNYELYS